MNEDTSITSCELGPIRPPSESASLLLRVSRNCPWNKCAFCAVYKGSRFSKREPDDLIAEIDLLADAADRVRARTGIAPDAELPAPAALEVVRDPRSSEEERRIALWLNRGGRHVFLQDADSLVRPPRRVIPILEHLTRRFPTVDRITTYARSRTLAVRTPEQLERLRQAGLTRIHVGVESGHDPLLELVRKGCRAEHHVTGCRRAVEAGFEVCCYVMPGLGGRRMSEGHARDTAAVLRRIDPQHVRLRTLWIDPGSPLEKTWHEGGFELAEEHEVVAEIRTMLRGLRGASGRVVSDHDRNLLMEIEGHLTEDAERLDGICARLLELPPETRDAFVVGRRAGFVRSLDRFLADPGALDQFTALAADFKATGDGSLVLGMARRLGRRSI